MDHNVLFVIISLIYISGVFVAICMLGEKEYTNNLKNGMDEETSMKETSKYMRYDTETDIVILSWVFVVVSLIFCIIPRYLFKKTKKRIIKPITTMNKNIIYTLLIICLTTLFTSCKVKSPNYNEELAFKMRPVLFGDTRVADESSNNFTVYALTTDAITFNILPQKKEFKFDDLLSNDNTPLDVSMYLVYQIQKGRTPELLRNYGEGYYSTFIEPYFKNKVRELVSTYSPFDLMSNREVLANFDKKIQESMVNYIKELSKKQGEFPITINQVVTDRVMPNSQQLNEMNKTAAAIQAKQTQEKRVEMEVARAKAENARAIADKAYMNAMNLSPAQFIQLRQWDVIEKKDGANIDVLVGGSEVPMWNIKR